MARYDLADRSASGEDFDMASAGLVRVLDDGRRGQRYPDMSWEPKAAFTVLAEYYRVLDRQASAVFSRRRSAAPAARLPSVSRSVDTDPRSIPRIPEAI